MLTSELIKSKALEFGADTVGIAEAAPVTRREEFLAWLDAGYAGEMSYLHKYKKERFDPRVLLPDARSIIVIGVNYFQGDEPETKRPFKIARYARRHDYHHVLRKILKRLRRHLQDLSPGLKGRICVDTAPFMDKYWAQKAGLGWQGRHTNLVSREYGSWLLLGSLIITEIVDAYDQPDIDHCGRCQRCVVSCPTQAIFKPYRLDATRCISYWTIESKAPEIDPDVAERMDDQIFGCDICLDVCPFNKFEKPGKLDVLATDPNVKLIENGRLDDLDSAGFDELFGNTPLSRAGLDVLKKNSRAFK